MIEINKEIKNGDLKELFSLGEMYVSDFVKDESDYIGRDRYEMKMMLEKSTGAVRLEKVPPAHTMWGKYWYRSGTNQTMKDHLEDVVKYCKKIVKLEDGDTWLDIACNDGTLLSFVGDGIKKIGIDPADDSFYAESSKIADDVIQDFFTREAYERSSLFKGLSPKVVTSIAMFYDLENPSQFIKDIGAILDPQGVWVLQMSYTPLMLKQLAFDNICHEHLYYYSLFNIKKLLNDNGFDVLDCTLNDANGGSFRVAAVKQSADKSKFSTKQNRDIFDFNVESLLAYEKTLALDSWDTWYKFHRDINLLKDQLKNFLFEAKKAGKRVCGYGASTKGNTLLQYFGIDNNLLESVVERSHYKFGLKTIGTNIPIISEDQMRLTPPDYLLVLPWHFIDEFVKRESKFLEAGGKFVVPCPEFKIIGA